MIFFILVKLGPAHKFEVLGPVPVVTFTDGLYTKGTRAHTHRKLIRKWLWEPKGSNTSRCLGCGGAATLWPPYAPARRVFLALPPV